MHDIIAIVAPRPLRPGLHLTHHQPTSSPLADALAAISLHDDRPPDRPTSTTDSDSPVSSRSSTLLDDPTESSSIQSTPLSIGSRLSLPQETLEEFLSISLKRINHRRWAHPYHRPHPYKSRKSSSSASSSAHDDDPHRRSRRGLRSNRPVDQDIRPSSPLVLHDDASEWSNFSLASPISRHQTRNPLARHPALEAISSNLRFSLDPYMSPPPLLLASPDMSPIQELALEDAVQR